METNRKDEEKLLLYYCREVDLLGLSMRLDFIKNPISLTVRHQIQEGSVILFATD